jgi:hypothetical protein
MPGLAPTVVKRFFFEKKQKTFGRFDFGAAGDAQPRGSKGF